MKNDYYVASSFRNRDQVNYLVDQIRHRGYTCHNFLDVPLNLDDVPKDDDFWAHPDVQKVFQRDIDGLRGASTVILLQPCGLSAHIEAGIAYGMGKRLIMIGEPVKPETLYLMFEERYGSVDDFLASVPERVAGDASSVVASKL